MERRFFFFFYGYQLKIQKCITNANFKTFHRVLGHSHYTYNPEFVIRKLFRIFVSRLNLYRFRNSVVVVANKDVFEHFKINFPGDSTGIRTSDCQTSNTVKYDRFARFEIVARLVIYYVRLDG